MRLTWPCCWDPGASVRDWPGLERINGPEGGRCGQSDGLFLIDPPRFARAFPSGAWLPSRQVALNYWWHDLVV